MAEGDALGPHHPVDHRAPGLADAEAVPEVLPGRDHQARLAVVVEGAQAEQVRAVALEPDPPRLGHRSSETSRFNRSISSAGMRAIENSFLADPVKTPAAFSRALGAVDFRYR